MGFSQRWHDIRTGFERPFWVANISELFERLSYYAAFASLARYLHEQDFVPARRADRPVKLHVRFDERVLIARQGADLDTTKGVADGRAVPVAHTS